MTACWAEWICACSVCLKALHGRMKVHKASPSAQHSSLDRVAPHWRSLASVKKAAMPVPICLQVSQELYAEQLQYTGTTSVLGEVHFHEQVMRPNLHRSLQRLIPE